jgi:hypothetical protein
METNPDPLAPERRDRAILAALILLGTAVRLLFWREAGLTYEDALITFRYVENLAAGNGFAYNPGEAVLGTTCPLWTLLLATARRLGAPDTAAAARVLAVLLDAATLAILFSALRRQRGRSLALLWGALFATSSGIVPITMSGMETPLLLFSMSVAFAGWTGRRSTFALGLAMTALTRIDGLLFAGVFLAAALLRDRRWALRQAAWTALLLAPWIVYARATFGDVLPQSLRAKRVAYAFDLARSLRPFLARYTPFGGDGHASFLLHLFSSTAVAAGILESIRRRRPFLPLAVWFTLYLFLFATSGVAIFPWYLTPATFAHDILLALGLTVPLAALKRARGGRAAGRATGAAALALVAVNLATIGVRLPEYREIQGIEDELRRPIGEWLRENTPPGGSVFLEPIGYIGYHAGPAVRIIDEVGIVSPEVTALRRRGPGWYVDALRALEPDLVVQYARSLEENVAEGTTGPLFRDAGERAWFFDRYEEVRRFEVRDGYPHIERKEKRYIVFRRVDP